MDVLRQLKKRIIDLSYEHNLSHIGSCLTAVEPLYEIYSTKAARDIVVLSEGHAGLALYVILEHFEGRDAVFLLKKYGVHPDRDIENGIHCSAGSLGHGLGIAVGMAIADDSRVVHCLISDGESAEGSIWESLNVIDEFKIKNIVVHVNINGWSAYKKVDVVRLTQMLSAHAPDNLQFHFTDVEQQPFLIGNEAHYKIMSTADYAQAIR